VGAVEDAAVWGNASTKMGLARQAGFGTIRMTAQWTSGQTAPSNLANLQRAVSAATSAGIEPMVAIYNADSHSTPADATSRAQFVAFAQAVVRGLPSVTTFIVGNEPNSNYYWLPQFDSSGADVAATAYEQLLAATYDAIKAVRPSATVVGGALSPHGGDNPTGSKPTHSPTSFIRDLGAAYRGSWARRSTARPSAGRPFRSCTASSVWSRSSRRPTRRCTRARSRRRRRIR
jgi:hypothetical protein